MSHDDHRDADETLHVDLTDRVSAADRARQTTSVSRLNQSVDIVALLYNSNPFYFISALLVLLGVRIAYGDIPVGSLNCWGMLAVLGAYTLVMALAAILVIRVGKVWDDARSIIVTLVLLFVAMSVSFDELLVIAAGEAFELTTAGWLFAVVVSELVMWLARIPLPAVFRLPYHAAIALLFWFPNFCSPELTGFSHENTVWRLFLFPWLVAAIVLSLLPAVWRGSDAVKDHGTPWKWPVYPWSLFVFLGVVCLLRTYVLTFSFEPSDGMATSFGGMHVLPIFAATAILLLEAGHRHKSSAAMYVAMALPAVGLGLVIFDINMRPSTALFHDLCELRLAPASFLAFTLTAVVYCWAWYRHVVVADLYVAAALAGAAVSFNGPQHGIPAWLFLAVGVGLFAIGCRTRSAARMVTGGSVVCLIWLASPLPSPLDSLRMSLTFHTALLALMIAGPVRGGRVGSWLINGVLVLFCAAGVAAFLNYDGRVMVPDWTISYLGIMACVSELYGVVIGDARFRRVMQTLASLFAIRVAFSGVEMLAKAIGPKAAWTIIAGAASFGIAGVISAVKSRRLSSEPEAPSRQPT